MIQYLTENLWLIWSILAVLCLILELSSGDFFLTCFAIGGLGAALVSLTGIPFWAQLLAFAVFSVLSVWLIRPALLRRLHSSGEERLSNADALIGRVGTVIEAIPAGGHGYVKIDGDEWKAWSHAGSSLAVGEQVRVVSRESIIICVERA